MEVIESSNKKEENILNTNNIIFRFSDILIGIESIFSFKDGDFLVFQNTFSILYDGKEFKKKLEIPFLGALCAFCYLSEEEFIILKDYSLTLYKFKDNRTSYEKLSIIYKNLLYEGENKNIFKLSNNDLLSISQNVLNPKIIRIFRRVEEKNMFKRYDLQDNCILEEIDDVINLEEDQFLGIKKYTNNDEILLIVYSNIDYNILRFNRIKCIIKGKRMIYFTSLPNFKVNKNKILMSGVSFLNIIDTETLELETTLKISENILDIRILSNNCIIFFEYYKTLEGLKQYGKYYLTKIWIDFETNDIIKKESNEITNEVGEYKTLFKLYNYKDNGLATIIDQNTLKIYKNVYC